MLKHRGRAGGHRTTTLRPSSPPENHQSHTPRGSRAFLAHFPQPHRHRHVHRARVERPGPSAPAGAAVPLSLPARECDLSLSTATHHPPTWSRRPMRWFGRSRLYLPSPPRIHTPFLTRLAMSVQRNFFVFSPSRAHGCAPYNRIDPCLPSTSTHCCPPWTVCVAHMCKSGRQQTVQVHDGTRHPVGGLVPAFLHAHSNGPFSVRESQTHCRN